MILELDSLYAYKSEEEKDRLCDKFDGCTAESIKVKILAVFLSVWLY